MEFLVDGDSSGSSPGPGLHWSQLPKGYNSFAFSSLLPTFSCLYAVLKFHHLHQRPRAAHLSPMAQNWRSSFFSPKNPVKISSIGATGGVLY
ncbi:unnamed protein product [Musa textilis]